MQTPSFAAGHVFVRTIGGYKSGRGAWRVLIFIVLSYGWSKRCSAFTEAPYDEQCMVYVPRPASLLDPFTRARRLICIPPEALSMAHQAHQGREQLISLRATEHCPPGSCSLSPPPRPSLLQEVQAEDAGCPLARRRQTPGQRTANVFFALVTGPLDGNGRLSNAAQLDARINQSRPKPGHLSPKLPNINSAPY